MPHAPPDPSPDDAARRLTALEEHAGFTEHAVEQLSAEVTECNKRLHALTARLAALETRLARLLQPNPDDQAPDAPADNHT